MPSNVITLKTFRDLWHIKGRALAIALILSFGVAAYIGIYASVDSLFNTRDAYYQELGAPDLEVLFLPQNPEYIPDITGISGVDQVEYRMVTMGNIQLKGGSRLPAVLVLRDNKNPSSISQLKVLEGSLPSPDDPKGVVVERSLAVYHGYKVGDTIRVNVGEESYEGRIRGVVMSSEYLTPTANPDYFVPQRGSLGVVFSDLARVKEVRGEVLVDDLLVRYKAGADKDATRNKIVNRVADTLAILKVTAKKEQFGYQWLQKDLGSFEVFVPAIIAVFILTSFLITLITFNRLVLSQRKEIGTLLAIGYGPGRLFSTFLIGGLFIGVAGAMLSIPFSFLVRNLFASEYAHAIGLPHVRYVLPWLLVLKGVGIALGIALLAAALPSFRVVRMSPQEAIRAPQKSTWNVGRRFLQALIRHLPSSAQFGLGLRNLFRRLGLAASTIICIALAVGVAIAYVVSMSSVNYTVKQYFAHDKWSLAVDFLRPESMEKADAVNSIDGIDRVVPMVKGGIQLFTKDGRLDCRLIGLPHDSPLNSLNLAEGRTFRGQGALEIVLDKEDARDLGAKIGDSIQIKAGMQQSEVILVGLITGLMRGQAYAGLELARGLLQMQGQTNGLFLSLKPGVAEEDTINQLYALDFVGKVMSKQGVVHDFLDLTSEIMGIVYLCAAFAILTGVLFIFTGITFNMLEREAEYATLQALGFGRRHLAGIVLSEVMAQAVIALLLSIPVAAMVSVFLTGRMSDAWFNVTNHFTLNVALWTLIPALLIMPLASVPGLRGIFRIDIAGAVRKAVMD